MTQREKREFLIKELLKEDSRYSQIRFPESEQGQRSLLRMLFNLRMPQPAGDEFLHVQDSYLQEEIRRKGITDVKDLSPIRPGLYLWQGDITTLRCDAIVNAANSQMLGCFCPNHSCIDNAIHTYAGIQLRLACAEQMRRQGRPEETGRAKITPAFNLPGRYVLHTVGPIVQGALTQRDRELLASCYSSCLELAEQHGLTNVAFCCISTGEFHFPGDKAAEIAIRTVTEYQKQAHSKIEVIFNVFKASDYDIYRKLLETTGKTEA